MNTTHDDTRELEFSLLRKRTFVNLTLNVLVTAVTLLAVVPLGAVLYMLVVKGGSHLSSVSFTELPPTALDKGGGFGNAIAGTLVMVGIASLISVPTGILGAIFLAEIAPGSRLAKTMRFLVRLMTGFPSVLAGVFAYGAVVMLFGGFSAYAGGVALAILMVPTVMLTAEEAIRMVPAKMKDAAMAMGTTQSQMVRSVLFPTAFPSMMTGVMLAVARASGETAPLIFTALFSNYWIVRDSEQQLDEPTASLAVLIYNFSASAFENQQNVAWAAALVLVLFVLVFNLLGQGFSTKQPK